MKHFEHAWPKFVHPAYAYVIKKKVVKIGTRVSSCGLSGMTYVIFVTTDVKSSDC